jgi:hypothetical protein
MLAMISHGCIREGYKQCHKRFLPMRPRNREDVRCNGESLKGIFEFAGETSGLPASAQSLRVFNSGR